MLCCEAGVPLASATVLSGGLGGCRSLLSSPPKPKSACREAVDVLLLRKGNGVEELYHCNGEGLRFDYYRVKSTFETKSTKCQQTARFHTNLAVIALISVSSSLNCSTNGFESYQVLWVNPPRDDKFAQASTRSCRKVFDTYQLPCLPCDNLRHNLTDIARTGCHQFRYSWDSAQGSANSRRQHRW